MTKMLLVRDLDPKNWPPIGHESALKQHDIVKMVFEGSQYSDGGDDDDNEEYVVDFHKYAELPLIFDADSSQHSALIDIVDGKNLVIEGPPGTGKSQTRRRRRMSSTPLRHGPGSDIRDLCNSTRCSRR